MAYAKKAHLHDRNRGHDLLPLFDLSKHHLLELNSDDRSQTSLMQADDLTLAVKCSLAKDGIGRKQDFNFDWITRPEEYILGPNVRHRNQGSSAAHVEG